MTDAERIEEMERRIAALEKAVTDKEERAVINIDLTLPEENLDGLHFNEQKVHAVFEKKEDGW
jgi:hypothetical protein